jgi:hypothetical protein
VWVKSRIKPQRGKPRLAHDRTNALHWNAFSCKDEGQSPPLRPDRPGSAMLTLPNRYTAAQSEDCNSSGNRYTRTELLSL